MTGAQKPSKPASDEKGELSLPDVPLSHQAMQRHLLDTVPELVWAERLCGRLRALIVERREQGKGTGALERQLAGLESDIRAQLTEWLRRPEVCRYLLRPAQEAEGA